MPVAEPSVIDPQMGDWFTRVVGRGGVVKKRGTRSDRSSAHAIAAFPGVLSFFLLIPSLAGAANAAADQARRAEIQRLVDVMQQVRANYVEPLSAGRIVDDAIHGIVDSLDSHSRYLSPEEYAALLRETYGEQGGIGVKARLNAGALEVVSTLDGSPASRAGLRPGDRIVRVNGRSVPELGPTKAVEVLRGQPGTEVRLTVRRRGGEIRRERLVRAEVPIPALRARRFGDVGYLRFAAFSRRTEAELRQKFNRLQSEGPFLAGYILDIRSNPGGVLQAAVAVVDAFTDDGRIAGIKGRGPSGEQVFTATRGDLAEGAPLVVLIDGGTASAAEVVAGALQDHDRAVILGTPSHGKGSVQTALTLRSGGALLLTTGRYHLPSGRGIGASGVTPDIVAGVGSGERTGSPPTAYASPSRTSQQSEPASGDSVPVEPGSESVEGESNEQRGTAPDPVIRRAIRIIHQRAW